ncbi:MAG: hypothetical protein ACJAY7_000739 [Pseudohongiellaceae bacterium]|jgi:hypothetical protein
MMKKIILKNRFTLLATIILAYVLLLVIEGVVTSREPALLRFDNSLFELNLEELNEISDRFM